MASPAGITTRAGPGSTIIAIPINNTELPRIATATRLSAFISKTFGEIHKYCYEDFPTSHASL